MTKAQSRIAAMTSWIKKENIQIFLLGTLMERNSAHIRKNKLYWCQIKRKLNHEVYINKILKIYSTFDNYNAINK